MPADRRTATRQHNYGLKREKFIQDTLQRINLGEIKSYRDASWSDASASQIADDALNRDFTGRMAAYKKCDLRALAVALSLSDKGTNAKLLSRIQNCFEENPDLKWNSQFSGLFHRTERKGPATNEDEVAGADPRLGDR
jgi:hypothetical protein